MDPTGTDLHAILALASLRMFHGRNRTDMCTALIRHGDFLSLVKYLMDEGDGNGALADGRSYALDVAAPHIPDRKHAGKTRFEKIWRPGERPSCGHEVVRRKFRS